MCWISFVLEFLIILEWLFRMQSTQVHNFNIQQLRKVLASAKQRPVSNHPHNSQHSSTQIPAIVVSLTSTVTSVRPYVCLFFSNFFLVINVGKLNPPILFSPGRHGNPKNTGQS